MARNARIFRHGNLITRVNGKMRHILNDYSNFLKSLDDPSSFVHYRAKIEPYPSHWNMIRKKYITASELRRTYT